MEDFIDLKKNVVDTTVVVAMSGGVDSSVVAALMKDKGYKVIGITMQLYDHGAAVSKKGACCAGSDIYDAKAVASKLSIPHYVLNYESLFRQSVMNDFADSYMRGETPIPCIRCNQTVKFSDMFAMAKDLGADALVTGHYVRRVVKDGRIELKRAVDYSKDQSYFLFATTRNQLDFLRFPLGAMTKDKTRKLAQKFNLPVFDKPDSQDICFVPNGSYAKVVEKLRPGALDPGKIMHVDGRVLGVHQGIINYTIGQRKGLGISSVEPLYVIKINPETKEIIVGPDEFLNKKSFTIKEVNWLIDSNNKEFKAQIKTRSTQSLTDATIIPLVDGKAKVVLDDYSRAITPGQACVIYDDDTVIGGGWITKHIN